ncbi:MAG TPA: DUF2208 domain-containing protein [Pyrodictiaceae archaeon]|nr:DUF2208 domain-containing protein [Pyrodictiaceae archaeon]HIQ56129.1 DUF2208 domain-containing protein [Pyrodictium sp.]
MDGKKMFLIQQLSTFLIATIMVFGGPYRWILFILYFVAISWASLMLTRKRGAKPDEILAGRIFYEEKNTREVMVRDEKLIEEMRVQSRMLTLTFATLVIAIAIFWVAGYFHSEFTAFVRAAISDNIYFAEFLYWVIVLEIIGIVNLALRKVMMPKQQLPLMPNRYIVTDRGIVIPGVMGFALKFPLEGYSIKLNEERNFVEIEGKGLRLRLYTSRPRRLYDIITRFGYEHKTSKSKTSSRG